MPQENYKRLINAIRLIAADYSTQVQSLPYFVNVPDEVALIFDDAYLGFKGSEAEISIPHEARNRWGQSLGTSMKLHVESSAPIPWHRLTVFCLERCF